MDIWKQLGASCFGHFLNMVLAMYLQQLTGSGNGCVWYFMNHSLDCTFGLMICYALFKVVDIIAVTHGIEALKSGVYMNEDVKLVEYD